MGHMGSSGAEAGVTWVRETPLESVVGMQQKTARPSVSSEEPRGRRCTARAARGVTARMEAAPKRMAPQADSARAASPRLRPRPEMMKMPARTERQACRAVDGSPQLQGCVGRYPHSTTWYSRRTLGVARSLEWSQETR